RHDLAQVEPDDLRGDALHREPGEEEDDRAAPRRAAFATPRSGHLEPIPAAPAEVQRNGTRAAGRNQTLEERIRQARLKGYEGDPCSECGQLTLVRSGSCAKCDTCGATSGCS